MHRLDDRSKKLETLSRLATACGKPADQVWKRNRPEFGLDSNVNTRKKATAIGEGLATTAISFDIGSQGVRCSCLPLVLIENLSVGSFRQATIQTQLWPLTMRCQIFFGGVATIGDDQAFYLSLRAVS
jgi:hypothetical protein